MIILAIIVIAALIKSRNKVINIDELSQKTIDKITSLGKTFTIVIIVCTGLELLGSWLQNIAILIIAIIISIVFIIYFISNFNALVDWFAYSAAKQKINTNSSIQNNNNETDNNNE